jgi:hypothetical protein
VVLNVAFGAETFAVDTHIFRVGNRTVRKLLLERKRWADIAVLYPHPLDELRREHEIAAIIKKRAPYNPFPESALLIYASLLAAGRNDEAKQVLAESYELEDTPEMHKFLDQAPSLIKSK